MKVILTEDHDRLGIRGDVVDVKPGYGRNYLIPRRMAVVATDSNRRRFEEERRQAAHKVEARREEAQKQAEALEDIEVVIPMRVGEENRIHGSVTTQQVAEELEERGHKVDRRIITLSEDIRVTGVYTAEVRLHPEYTAEIKIKVVPMDSAL